MRRFVGASALALAVSILTVGARGDTVDSNDKVVSAAKAGQGFRAVTLSDQSYRSGSGFFPAALAA